MVRIADWTLMGKTSTDSLFEIGLQPGFWFWIPRRYRDGLVLDFGSCSCTSRGISSRRLRGRRSYYPGIIIFMRSFCGRHESVGQHAIQKAFYASHPFV